MGLNSSEPPGRDLEIRKWSRIVSFVLSEVSWVVDVVDTYVLYYMEDG